MAPVAELADVIDLAESEARRARYAQVLPQHLLLGLLAAEHGTDSAVVKAARAQCDRMRSEPPARVDSRRVPLSGGALMLVFDGGDRAGLRERLREHGPGFVRRFLDGLEVA